MGASSGRPFSLVTANQEEPRPKTTTGRAGAADGTRAYTWIGPNGRVRTIKNTEMWKLVKTDFALSQMQISSGLWTALLTPHTSTAHSAVRVTTASVWSTSTYIILYYTRKVGMGHQDIPRMDKTYPQKRIWYSYVVYQEELKGCTHPHKLAWYPYVVYLWSDDGARPPSVV